VTLPQALTLTSGDLALAVTGALTLTNGDLALGGFALAYMLPSGDGTIPETAALALGTYV